MTTPVTTDLAISGYVEAFTSIVDMIRRSLDGSQLEAPVTMWIAGGAALYLHTGAHAAEQIHATFSRKILLPQGLQRTYLDADNAPRCLALAIGYNPRLVVIHPDADRDAWPLELPSVDARRLVVRIHTPIDLAVAALSRRGPEAEADIRALGEKRLIDAGALRARAREALDHCVGDVQRVERALDAACSTLDPFPKRIPKLG